MPVTETVDRFRRRAFARLSVVLVWLGAMWAVFLLDVILPDSLIRLDQQGIRPREVRGLFGIPAAPFLHVDIWHLLANTLPVIILGWILSLSSRRLFLTVFVVTGTVSGLGSWLFGQGDLIHEGASGVIYGMLGFLLARGWFARHLGWTLVSLVIAFFHLGALFSLLKVDPHISWSGHFWGFAGGIGLAWWLHGRPADSPRKLPAI